MILFNYLQIGLKHLDMFIFFADEYNENLEIHVIRE